MKSFFKLLLSAIIITTSLFAMSGCSSKDEEIQSIKKNLHPIQTIYSNDNYDDLMPLKNILQNKTIIGMGEATHGNKEFFQMKQHVFEFLVKETGVKVFAVEGDFGGGQTINNYILYGTGTAEDAAKSLDMAIYKTQEFTNMLKWMHDYNQTVTDKNKIHFYGFDMQRYDRNKDALFSYINKVDSSLVSDYKNGLTDLNDNTVFDQKKEKIKPCLDKIKVIIDNLNSNKDKYIHVSSEKEYSIALEHANIILQNATIRYGTSNYSTTRDAYMAGNIKWILEYEKLLGNDKIFVSAHDGHIEKSSSSSFHCMGNILSDNYGKQYYALGTEFYESTFNCMDNSDNKRKLFNIKANNSGYLANKLMQTEINIGWMDFATASSDKVVSNLLQKPQMLHNIGESFSRWMYISDRLYMLKQTPAKAYDGLIFIKTVTSSTPLSGEKYILVKSFSPLYAFLIILFIILISVLIIFKIRSNNRKRQGVAKS